MGVFFWFVFFHAKENERGLIDENKRHSILKKSNISGYFLSSKTDEKPAKIEI